MIESSVDIGAFLLLNKFIKRLANRDCGSCLLIFLAARSGDNLWREIARHDLSFITQCTGTLDSVLEFTDVSGVIVPAENLHRLGIDLHRFSPSGARVLL